MPEIELQSKLTLFDATNLVVGATIGADIYIVSSFGAGYLGPASLLAWVVGGVIAIIIALCFAQCAALLPRVGGSYAYAREAWGPLAGFVVGWSLWLAEWVALAAFPVAFVRYLLFFLPDLPYAYQIVAKVLFVIFLAATNIVGSKAAGRTNDVLTILKLSPLILFLAVGSMYMFLNPGPTASNFVPFSPLGFSNFGMALVLVFWAYAGFEISTIPAEEIKEPGKTIPKAMMIGMAIVTVFYLTMNLVLFGVRNWTQLASDTTPIVSAIKGALNMYPQFVLVGGAFVAAGALISIAGAEESGMLGTSSLGYAMAADGLFPRAFAKIHSKYKTPYLAIIIQSITALVASMVADLSMLVATSVLFLAIAYTATCASVFPLRKKIKKPLFNLKGGLLIPSLGILVSLFLITQCTPIQIAIGLILLSVGVPIYFKYAPKKEITELKEYLVSREYILKRAYHQERTFLANILRLIKRSYRRITKKQQTWK